MTLTLTFDLDLEKFIQGQSEPNLHRRLLTGIAQPSPKMGIAGHMQTP